MSDRIQRAKEHAKLDGPLVATLHDTDDPDAATGQTMAILASSYRIVLKSGRVCGARACALSARAAARSRAAR